nr:MAG: major capsid protein [Microvirus sp.]
MKRYHHNLSNSRNYTGNFGNLIPLQRPVDMLPGDTLSHVTSALIRMSPLVAPVMHPVHAKIHHFRVDFRLIWEEFDNFITGGPTGTFTAVPPYVVAPAVTGWVAGSLADYLGMPINQPNIQVSALPFRAYWFVRNTMYRNQQLMAETAYSVASGLDVTTPTTTCAMAPWMDDYFTAAKPEPQLGPETYLPLGTSAPVTENGDLRISTGASGPRNIVMGALGGNDLTYSGAVAVGNSVYASGLEVDLTAASSASVSDLALAMAVQRMKIARNKGARIQDMLKQWGVQPSDRSLDLPLYLGGGTETIQFSEVLQTGPDSADEGVGNLYGHGIGAMRSNAYTHFFDNFSYCLSLGVVNPITVYHQGIHKSLIRQTKEDFWNPELEATGMQAITNKEVVGNHVTPDGIFGFIDKYNEYREINNSVAGEFHPGELLEDYTLARDLPTNVALNSAFVTSNPSNRIFASTTTHQLRIMARHNMSCYRKVSKYAPTLSV